MYADLDEMQTAKEGSIGVLMGTPGTQLLVTLPQSPVRGVYTAAGNGRQFAVAGNGFYEIINTSGVWSYNLIGSLASTTGTVSMADNGTSVFIVDGASGYYYNFSEKNLLSLYLFQIPQSSVAYLGNVYSNNANTFTLQKTLTSEYVFSTSTASATVGAVYIDPNTSNQFTVLSTLSSSASLICFGAMAPTLNYSFTVSSANATVGATYVDPANNTFTVQQTISSGTTLLAYGSATPVSGVINLTKASGTGDSNIIVSSNISLGGSLTLSVPTTGSGDVNNSLIPTTAIAKNYYIVCSANGAPTNGATTLSLSSGTGTASLTVYSSTQTTGIVWTPLTTYAVGQIIIPVSNGYQYTCTTGGISAASIPTFPTTSGATVTDGSVVWTRISTFQQTTDPGFLGSNVITYQDGYFFFAKPNSNQVYCSNLNDVTFNALNFLSLGGSPANVLNMVSLHRNLYIQTTKTTEVYYNAGVSPGFPFSRINGGYLEQGLIAQFSLCQTANAMFWLGQDKSGSGIVYTTTNFLPERISTYAVEEQLSTYSTISDAIGYTYQEAGHQFYVLNFPTAQATWCYDVSTGLWHERAYNNNGQQQMQLGIYHTFGGGVHLVGDYTSGNIYQMAQTIYTDNGTPIIRKRVAPHLASDMRRIFFSKLLLDIQQGVGIDGTGQGSDPKVMLRFSDDGGRRWSNIQTATIGPIGHFKRRAMFRRLGSARDRVFEITISDPVFVAIVGAELRIEVGNY